MTYFKLKQSGQTIEELLSKIPYLALKSDVYTKTKVYTKEETDKQIAEASKKVSKHYTFESFEDMESWVKEVKDTGALNDGDVLLVKDVVNTEPSIYWYDASLGTAVPSATSVAAGNYLLDQNGVLNVNVEEIIEDYAVRETIYIGLDGYCYSRPPSPYYPNDDIVYPISNLKISEETIHKYDFILCGELSDTRYDYIPLIAEYEDTAGIFYFYAIASVYYTCYQIRGVCDGSDEAITFTIVEAIGDYLKNYYGALHVDKTALLGDIGNRTMKEYTDAAIAEAKKEPVLIETIEVTEEGVTAVARTEEPDGTPYNFKSVEFYINQKKGANNSQGGLIFDIKEAEEEATVSSPLLGIPQGAFSSTSDSYTMCRAGIRHGNLHAETTTKLSSSASYQPASLFVPNYTITNSAKAVSIHGFKYYSLNSFVIPVGTTIEIWGERNA